MEMAPQRRNNGNNQIISASRDLDLRFTFQINLFQMSCSLMVVILSKFQLELKYTRYGKIYGRVTRLLYCHHGNMTHDMGNLLIPAFVTYTLCLSATAGPISRVHSQ